MHPVEEQLAASLYISSTPYFQLDSQNEEASDLEDEDNNYVFNRIVRNTIHEEIGLESGTSGSKPDHAENSSDESS